MAEYDIAFGEKLADVASFVVTERLTDLDVLRHYPPDVVAQMAVKVAAFARQHWQSIRIK